MTGLLSHQSWRKAERHQCAEPATHHARRSLIGQRLSDGGVRRGFRSRRPLGTQSGLPHVRRSFDMSKVKQLDLAAVQRPANQVFDAALRWLDERKSGPFFTWIHLYDPHTPYEPPEPLMSEFSRRGPAGPYDGEIAFVDQQVDRLLTWLRSTGIDQRTIISSSAIMARRWEVTVRGRMATTSTTMPCTCRSSWRRRSTRLQGVRVDSQVSLVDVFPTVLALTGIEVKSRVHGRSLLPLMFRFGSGGGPSTPIASRWRPTFSSGGARFTRCVPRATSSSKRRGRSFTTSLRIQEKRPTSSRSRQRLLRDGPAARATDRRNEPRCSRA